MAIIRLAAIIIAIEALFYVLISYYLRSLRRERLEDIWDQRHPDRAGRSAERDQGSAERDRGSAERDRGSAERDEFVRRSMHGFHRTLRARLVALVFVVPTIAIFVIAYFVNHG